MIRLIVLAHFFVLLLTSCETGSKYVGMYTLDECRFDNDVDCTLSNRDAFLELSGDRKFKLQVMHQTVQGIWRFRDDGERAYITLVTGNSKDGLTQHDVSAGVNDLDIDNPHILTKIDSLRHLKFVKRSTRHFQ
jgi:hypothetical protein